MNTTILPRNYTGEPIIHFKVETEEKDSKTFFIALDSYDKFSHLPRFKEGLIISTFPDLKSFIILGIGKTNSTVYFRRKHIKAFAEIKFIHFENFSISNFDEDLFFEIEHVEKFYMRGIDHSSKLNIAKFLKNSRHLNSLWIENCETLVLPQEPMKNNDTLIELELKQNKITNLPERFFQSLGIVEKINLSGNIIEEIAIGLFHKCTELMELFLTNNQIEWIRRGTFKNNQKLIKLDLKHNKLQRIEQRFDKINALEHLNLRNNPCVDLYLENRDEIEVKSKIIIQMCKIIIPDYEDD